MLNRRQALGTALSAGVVTLSGAARAAGWRDKYPELVMGIVPAENASGVADRYAPFVAHLVATKDQHPQTRERRRADPNDALAAYRAAAALTA